MAQPEAMERIIGRLRKGQSWLTAENDALLALPDIGLGSPQETRFLEALDLWDNLDQLLRSIYGFTRCPMVGVCQRDAPVICRACGAAASPTSGR